MGGNAVGCQVEAGRIVMLSEVELASSAPSVPKDQVFKACDYLLSISTFEEGTLNMLEVLGRRIAYGRHSLCVAIKSCN